MNLVRMKKIYVSHPDDVIYSRTQRDINFGWKKSGSITNNWNLNSEDAREDIYLN